MSFLAGLSLMLAGVVNLLAGFLGLFPGLFEASAADPGSDSAVGWLELVGTPYGRYAVGHLVGSGLQLVGGSRIGRLMRSPLFHGLAVLCAVSLGLELWGWALKETLSPLAAPGLVAAALTGLVYGRLLQSGTVA
ncbi:MAG: hypothetical protein ABFS41_04580 [Myxococcota bacterium]